MSTQTSKDNLEWGDHDSASADNKPENLKPEKSIVKDKSASNDDKSVDLSKDEPGRNRKGVKEGESSISEDDQ